MSCWFKIKKPEVGMTVSSSDINLWHDQGRIIEITDNQIVKVKWNRFTTASDAYLPNLIEWREPKFPDECSHYPGLVCHAQHTISHDACREANERP